MYCPKCGSPVSSDGICHKCNEQVDNKNIQVEPQSQPNNQDSSNGKVKANFGYGVLGFFIPLAGLILYLCWNKTQPGDAKGAGLGALIKVITVVVFMIIFVIIMVIVFGSVAKGIDHEYNTTTTKATPNCSNVCTTGGYYDSYNDVCKCYDGTTKEYSESY